MSVARGGSNSEIFTNTLIGTFGDLSGAFLTMGGSEIFELLPLTSSGVKFAESATKQVTSSIVSSYVSENISGSQYVAKESKPKKDKNQQKNSTPIISPTAVYLELDLALKNKPKQFGYNWNGL